MRITSKSKESTKMKTTKRLKTKLKLHEILTDIKSGPLSGHYGICWEVRRRDEDFYDGNAEEALKRLFKTWPKFSGNLRFPIPSPIVEPPSDPFYRGIDRGNNWNKRTKYGRLRWELLDFLIDATKPEDK
jgi:hypothetical protein